jgi:hypothetical protein
MPLQFIQHAAMINQQVAQRLSVNLYFSPTAISRKVQVVKSIKRCQ